MDVLFLCKIVIVKFNHDNYFIVYIFFIFIQFFFLISWSMSELYSIPDLGILWPVGHIRPTEYLGLDRVSSW